jgi:hypothetical protein
VAGRPFLGRGGTRREQGIAFLKGYRERGLAAAGIKLLATGDITNDGVLDTIPRHVISYTTTRTLHGQLSATSRHQDADWESIRGFAICNSAAVMTHS